MADKGRKLREKGKTITGNRIKTAIAGNLGALGTSYGLKRAQQMYNDKHDPRSVNTMTALATVPFGASVAYSIIQAKNNRNMRMYDLHSSRHVTEGNKRVANMLNSKLGKFKIGELSDGRSVLYGSEKNNNSNVSNVEYGRNGKIKRIDIDLDAANQLRKNGRATINF